MQSFRLSFDCKTESYSVSEGVFDALYAEGGMGMQENDLRLHTCSLAGPRGLSRQALADLAPRLYRAVSRMMLRHDVCCFCCAMTDGFDLLAAQTVLHMRGGHPDVRLILYHPQGGDVPPSWQAIGKQAERIVDYADTDALACPVQALEQSAFCLAYRKGRDAAVQRTVQAARQHGVRIVSLTQRPLCLP